MKESWQRDLSTHPPEGSRSQALPCHKVLQKGEKKRNFSFQLAVRYTDAHIFHRVSCTKQTSWGDPCNVIFSGVLHDTAALGP